MDKAAVHDFWNAHACGEEQYLREGDYDRQARIRYELEPYIQPFALFEHAKGRRVLEIGVGLGADHERFARAGAVLYGIDLTHAAVEHTHRRLTERGLFSGLRVADAESLPYADGHFDLVYSWGVIHHSPDTQKAVDEIRRVLRQGGVARVMIYHRYSMVGLMLALRYGFWKSLDHLYAHHLESPGTKAYSIREAEALFRGFIVQTETKLTHADLLTSDAGQRHQGTILRIARRIWPRWFIRRFMKSWGLHMMITAWKQ